MNNRDFPEAVVAQMIRADIILGKYTVRADTNQWRRKEGQNWVRCNTSEVQTLVLEYCMNKYLTSTDEDTKKAWEYYLSLIRQKNVMLLIKMHEEVSKGPEFYVPDTIDMLWNDVLVPSPDTYITSTGLYKVYQGHCEQLRTRFLGQRDFVNAMKNHHKTIEHGVIHRQYYKPAEIKWMPWEAPMKSPRVWKGVDVSFEHRARLGLIDGYSQDYLRGA